LLGSGVPFPSRAFRFNCVDNLLNNRRFHGVSPIAGEQIITDRIRAHNQPAHQGPMRLEIKFDRFRPGMFSGTKTKVGVLARQP
jgi:hypothetical protein